MYETEKNERIIIVRSQRFKKYNHQPCGVVNMPLVNCNQ